MKKFAAMAILALGVVFAANAYQEKNSSVRIVQNLQEMRYSVVYTTEDKNPVRVKIYNSNGSIIHNERISGGSFWKAYDFKNQKAGLYKFEIIDGDNTITREVAHKLTNKELAMKVDDLGNSKFKVSVRGVDHNPVTVSVKDSEGNIVYYDEVNTKADFDRVFDLSKFNSSEFTFTVEKDEQVIVRSI